MTDYNNLQIVTGFPISHLPKYLNNISEEEDKLITAYYSQFIHSSNEMPVGLILPEIFHLDGIEINDNKI